MTDRHPTELKHHAGDAKTEQSHVMELVNVTKSTLKSIGKLRTHVGITLEKVIFHTEEEEDNREENENGS